jgi:hypothetical protein
MKEGTMNPLLQWLKGAVTISLRSPSPETEQRRRSRVEKPAEAEPVSDTATQVAPVIFKVAQGGGTTARILDGDI